VEPTVEHIKPEQTEQLESPKSPASPVSSTVSPTGRRLAFQDIKRQLTEAELQNTGTQKMILELLLTTEAERDELKNYVPKYYEADKRAGILEEKLKTNKANEIMFGAGIGAGMAIIGLAPFFWDDKGHGPIALVVGAAITLGAIVGRICYK
jgi:hypothetical protein